MAKANLLESFRAWRLRSRLYAEANGVEHVFVNGTPIVADGKLTDARPGTMLRSGRDSHTASL